MNKINNAIHGVKEFYRNVTMTPTNHEEEEKNLELACNITRAFYLFWTSDYRFVKDLSKPLAGFIITLVILFLISGQIYYTVMVLDGSIVFDIEECLLIFGLAGLHIGTFVFRPLIILLFYEELTSSLNFISSFKAKLFSKNKPIDAEEIYSDKSVEDVFRRENIVFAPVLLCILFFTSYTLYAWFPPFCYFLKGGNQSPNGRHYYFVFPFYDQVQSLTLYYVITSIASLAGIVEGSFAFAGIVLMNGLGLLRKYEATTIRKKIHKLSTSFAQDYEKRFLTEGNWNEQNYSENTLTFEGDLIQLIGEYRTFSLEIEGTLKFLNVFLPLIISCGATMMFGISAVLFLVSMPMLQRIQYLIGIFDLSISLYTCCSVAKNFEDVSEIYRGAVYNLPWYYLPPKTRKIINIFQNVVFKEQEFKILRVTSINMALFPRLWYSVYSYVSVLRTTATND